MRTRTGVALATMGALALAALWLALSPGWAVAALRDAAAAGDDRRAEAYVDRDALRRSVASQIAAQMTFAQASGKRIETRDAVAAMNAAQGMAAQIDAVRLVSAQVKGGPDPAVTRTGPLSFTLGPLASGSRLDFELRGLTWKAVDLKPGTRR